MPRHGKHLLKFPLEDRAYENLTIEADPSRRDGKDDYPCAPCTQSSKDSMERGPRFLGSVEDGRPADIGECDRIGETIVHVRVASPPISATPKPRT